MTAITDALKLIVARSPRAGEYAIRAMQAAANNSPVLTARYQQVLIMALADPEAEFTPAEREKLADALEPVTETRDFILRVRLTEAERQTLAELAGDQSLSDYVRQKIFS